MWDLDPQAAATYLFRVRPRVKGGGERIVAARKPIVAAIKATDFTDLDLLPADFTLRNMDLLLDRTKRPTRRLTKVLEPLQDEYDLAVLDCPPSVSLVSENVLAASDLVLSPMIPATLSVRTFDQLRDFVADVHTPARLTGFFSMVDRRKRLHREMVESMTHERDGVALVARASIPAQSLIEQMAVQRAPVPYYAPRSSATRSYRALFDEVLAGA